MARLQYFVLLHQDKWMVRFDDRYYGPFASRRAAIGAAIDAAYETGEDGYDSQVLVQRAADHQWRTEWIYRRDPYRRTG